MLDKEYPDNDTAVSEIALIDCLLIVGQRCAAVSYTHLGIRMVQSVQTLRSRERK